MEYQIAFYVHHHGSGHLMRTRQIISRLTEHHVTLIGSGLSKIKNLPANVSILELPMDTVEQNELKLSAPDQTTGFHYAPLGIKGLRGRTAIMSRFFNERYPILLVVDVSVEVTLLARLAGIPTIVMRQHGKRSDLPHQLAYESAELLIAPYPKGLHKIADDPFLGKTIFSGGFAKLSGKNIPGTLANQVYILIGSGGTSLNERNIISIARQCQNWNFKVLGDMAIRNGPSNLVCLGYLTDPLDELSPAQVIIGNTGHNTVMETAALNCRFIGIPEDRPFDEQVEKARAISDRAGIRIVYPENIATTAWNSLLEEIILADPDWSGVIAPGALNVIAEAIICTGNRLFEKG